MNNDRSKRGTAQNSTTAPREKRRFRAKSSPETNQSPNCTRTTAVAHLEPIAHQRCAICIPIGDQGPQKTALEAPNGTQSVQSGTEKSTGDTLMEAI